MISFNQGIFLLINLSIIPNISNHRSFLSVSIELECNPLEFYLILRKVIHLDIADFNELQQSVLK